MISILVGTKGRPSKLANLINSIDIPCQLLIAADEKFDIPPIIQVRDGVTIAIVYKKSPLVKKINLLATMATYNMLAIADDCEFIPGALSRALSEIDADGLTGFRTANMKDATPILVWGTRYFAKYGYLLHPSYIHFYSDTDAIDEARKDGKFKVVEIELANHFHPSVTGIEDETHKNMRAERLIHDEAVYRERSRLRSQALEGRKPV